MADDIEKKIEEPIIKDAEVKELKGNGERPTQRPVPKMRQIIIETDGNKIKMVKSEVSGKIELVAILQNIINYINSERE